MALHVEVQGTDELLASRLGAWRVASGEWRLATSHKRTHMATKARDREGCTGTDGR
jgi:hypothetical protein